MTVSTAPTPLTYNGNGSTTAFPVTWKYNAKSHVVATLRSAAGVETAWVLTTNYTLTNPGDSGTLTALVAPAVGETLVITLEPPNTQASDIPLGGDFPSTTVEDGLDLSAQRDAKIEALFSRSLRVPKTDTQTDSELELPIDSARANMFLAFDSNGAPIAASGTSADLGPVTSFVNTLLDDVDSDSLVQTLVSGLTAETSPAANDVFVFGDTSESKGNKITLADMFKVVTLLSSETSPAVDDELPLYDTSAGTGDKITISNLLKVINSLTTDAAPDFSADYLLTYDASATAAKKVLLNSLGAANGMAKAWVFITFSGGTPTASASLNVTSLTDNGVGDITVNFTTAFSSTNYAVAGAGKIAGVSSAGGGDVCVVGDLLTTSARMGHRETVATFGGVDNNFSAIFFGAQ